MLMLNGHAWWNCHSFLSVSIACLPDVKGLQAVESLRNIILGYYGQEAVVKKLALQAAQTYQICNANKSLENFWTCFWRHIGPE